MPRPRRLPTDLGADLPALSRSTSVCGSHPQIRDPQTTPHPPFTRRLIKLLGDNEAAVEAVEFLECLPTSSPPRMLLEGLVEGDMVGFGLGVASARQQESGFERLGIKVRFGLVMVFGFFGGRVVSLIILYLYV